jgi:hypothetical protein
MRIEQRDIFRDRTALLQNLDPSKTRRRRQIDPSREFDIRKPSILLKRPHDGGVSGIEGCHGKPQIIFE